MKKRPVKIARFAGKNNVADPEEAGRYDLQTAVNVDVDDHGKIRRRKGTTKVYSGTPESLFSDGKTILFVEDSVLKSLDPSAFTATTLSSDLLSARNMAYLDLNGDIYYTDGSRTGIVENGAARSWGLTPPPPPVVDATVGELPSGRYQVALTYVRNDGQESGALTAAHIDVTGGGISLTGIAESSDSTVDYVNIYLTPTDGEVLYRAMTVANGTTTVTYRGDGKDLISPMRTQHLSPPPSGHLLAFHKGRIYIADGNILWYTEPFKYELVDLAHNYIAFDDHITAIGPVNGGMWLSTASATMFLPGDAPEKFKPVDKANYGAIEGTIWRINGKHIKIEGVAPDKAWIWASIKGICLGTADGFFVNLTDGRYEMPSAPRGIGLVREERDNSQYLVGLYYSRFIAMPGYTVTGTGTANT